MISRNPNHPEEPQLERRGLTWKVWVPAILITALITGTLLFVVLPRFWDVLFPPELEEGTATLVLLKQLDQGLFLFIARHPDVSLDSFFVEDELNPGAKAMYRCLYGKRYLNDEIIRARGHIAIDVDGQPMFIDAWRHPVVFIPKSASGRSFTYRNGIGNSLTIRAPIEPTGPRYLLWSLGPDGLNQDGAPDDLTPRPRTPSGKSAR